MDVPTKPGRGEPGGGIGGGGKRTVSASASSAMDDCSVVSAMTRDELAEENVRLTQLLMDVSFLSVLSSNGEEEEEVVDRFIPRFSRKRCENWPAAQNRRKELRLFFVKAETRVASFRALGAGGAGGRNTGRAYR